MKVFKWLIANLKTISIILGIAGSVVVGIRQYNTWVINKNNEKKVQQNIVTELKTINVKIDSIGAGLVVLNARTTEIKSVVDEHTKGMKRLEGSHKSLLKDLGKIDLLLQYYEEETLKKNSYVNEIQLEPNNFWTPLVLKSEK